MGANQYEVQKYNLSSQAHRANGNAKFWVDKMEKLDLRWDSVIVDIMSILIDLIMLNSILSGQSSE